jgi:hypothetical protein
MRVIFFLPSLCYSVFQPSDKTFMGKRNIIFRRHGQAEVTKEKYLASNWVHYPCFLEEVDNMGVNINVFEATYIFPLNLNTHLNMRLKFLYRLLQERCLKLSYIFPQDIQQLLRIQCSLILHLTELLTADFSNENTGQEVSCNKTTGICSC